jgi:uncharacterized protein
MPISRVMPAAGSQSIRRPTGDRDVQGHRIDEKFHERILRGQRNWWFVGPGGIARMTDRHLTADGTPTPEAERHLRSSGLYDTKPPSFYSLTVLTSTDCNLGCGYCFQNTGQDLSGKNRPPRISHTRLTSGTITTTLEFAHRQMSAVGLEKLHILLFGGEPLLNPRGCLELLARAADYGLKSAGMVSNATLLTPELARQLADLGLGYVQVTFDGDRDRHDLIRVRRSGGGTFDAIIANIVRASQASPLRWSLRVNVSDRNYGTVDGLLDQLADQLEPGRCRIGLAWVGDVGIGYANGLRRTARLTEDFLRWRVRAREMGFQVSKPGARFPCLTCSFDNGRYGATVNADGTLASCWETAGKPGWEVGTAASGYLPAEQVRDRWISCLDNGSNADDDATPAAFDDAVDAAYLDYLDESGQLA